MRPVNLIPPDERRGPQAPLRRGRLSYIAIGALVAVLALVSAVMLMNRQIADRKAELASLEQRQEAADAKVKSLQAFASLRTVADQRVATVTSLAQSRFDWERVMRELSRILPSDVWLVSLAGTVRPGIQMDDVDGISTRDSVPGPALEIVGCAKSQDAVAAFVSDVKDIDGVTRVGVFEAKRPDRSAAGPAATGGSTPGGDCRTKDTISRFRLIAAFDRVPTPQVSQAAPAPNVPPAGQGAAPSGSQDSQALASAQAQEAEAKNSSATQTAKARKATNLVPK